MLWAVRILGGLSEELDFNDIQKPLMQTSNYGTFNTNIVKAFQDSTKAQSTFASNHQIFLFKCLLCLPYQHQDCVFLNFELQFTLRENISQ